MTSTNFLYSLKSVLKFLDPGMIGAGRQAKPLVANYCLTERHFQLPLQVLIKKNKKPKQNQNQKPKSHVQLDFRQGQPALL